MTTCPVCSTPVPAGVPFCPVCDTPIGGSAADPAGRPFEAGLRFPWGFESVAESRNLGLGSDQSFSTLAWRLAAFGGVAARHAEVARVGDVLYLRAMAEDVHVAGAPLPPGHGVRLHDGDIVEIAGLKVQAVSRS